MFEPKRLHPASAAIISIKKLKELIVPAVAFLLFGSSGGGRRIVLILFAIIGVLVAIVSGILTWLRFTYRIEENELKLEYGIFIRKKRYIPLERIQSIDQSEGIFHRPFGLVQIKIETAGGGTGSEATEAELTAITRKEAEALEEAIFSGRKFAGTSNEAETKHVDHVIYTLSPPLLLLMASTSGGIGVVISAVFALFSQFDEFIPYKRIFSEVETIIANGVIFVSILIFLGFLIAWILAIAGTMIKYGNYVVMKTNDDLIISRGLLEKRKMTIPLKRIQAIQITQNPLRELFGYASVQVESAGGSAVDKDSAKVLLLPLVKVSEIERILGGQLPSYHFNTNLVRIPKRALVRYAVRSMLYTLPIAAAAIFLLRPWGYLALLLPILGVVWAYICYRSAGWGVSGRQLSLRFRIVSKTTVYLLKNKIQSLDMSESYFQKRKQLARVDAYAKSGFGIAGGGVRDLDAADALFIYTWYSQNELK
ncbi:hypothetical protein A8F94_23640 [Bacillus sp. FJAT-27225]|nr:PH domain-containing protein [Bacillus sp. FJAT-27225]OCA89364.1 hypothetical protein A8F94_23640 [Bacillus sp. FJAT-27225]